VILSAELTSAANSIVQTLVGRPMARIERYAEVRALRDRGAQPQRDRARINFARTTVLRAALKQRADQGPDRPTQAPEATDYDQASNGWRSWLH
jgi:hypothetical protein